MNMRDVTIENYEKVYDYFRDFKQSPKFARRWYAFTGIVFKPRIHYAKGARKDLDLIRDNDHHHIYVFNHQDDWDGYVFFSALGKIAPYDVGKIRGMATSQCFESPFPQAFRNTGYIPVFLKAYYAKARRHKSHPERLALIPAASQAMFKCFADIMTMHRQKFFVCPEGMYNTGAPDTILPIRSGTAEIALRVAKADGPVAITAIGVAYGKKRHRVVYPRRASVSVGRPIFVDGNMTTDEITKQIGKHLLSSVKKAVDLY